VGRHLTRWLIPLPAILLSFFSQVASAQPINGLNAVGYIVSEIPPTQSDSAYPICHSELENNINRNYNGEPFGNCPVDNFMVHYTGFITIPENNSIQFMVAADDGGTIKIGDTEFGTWNDKGCSWSAQTTNEFVADSYALDGWFYEHGGGTCFMLAWNIDNTGWAIVPDTAFTTTATPTPTTTTTTTTITTTTTTTLPPTTTISSTTTVQESTTTWVQSTTSTTTTTTTSTTVQPTTVLATTTTTTQPSTTTSTTTTTTVPELLTTTTSQQPLEQTTTTSTTTTQVPETQTATTTTTEVTPTTYASTTTLLAISSTTLLELPTTADSTTTTTTTFLEPTTTVDTQLVMPISVPNEISAQEATKFASSAEVLQQITQEQATEVFAALDLDELQDNEIEQIVDAVQSAPAEVREAFETEINIFDGKTDSYVPLGSTVSVGARRVLVAVTGVLIVGSVATSAPQSHTSRKNG
jgi:hypothetical protein